MPNVTIAHQTLAKIDGMIKADQGSAYRGLLGRVLPHIGDAYREGDEGHRSHLGASIIGGECPRAIWYAFRWVTRGAFEGRILRLFNRGHLEEGRFIPMFLMIGCPVYQQDENGKQYRISHAEGHFGGSGDGVIVNIPDLPPGTAALSEFKTHSEKSFIELAGPLKEWRAHLESPHLVSFPGKGVREAKFEHFVQMQVYMRKMGLPAGIYCAVNKNTDDLYMEIITLDTALADQFLDRGNTLVWMSSPPKRISETPGFWKCRFCDHRPVCHLKAAPDRNCRNCEFSAPMPGAEWHCTKHGVVLSKDEQHAGCDDYTQKHDL